VDWSRLAGLGGTIVCYAGPRQIRPILDALAAHGRPADETAALVYDGTTPAQQTVEGTVGTLADQAREGRPALLVVGAVAGLRQHLRWFDERPLFGRRIVVTRSREQAGELIEMLEERGAEAIAAPTIRIAPPEDTEELDRACAQAGTFDWIVFTSANGVDAFMQRLLAMSDVRELKGVRICTTGSATAAHVQRYGIRVDLVPSEFRAEAVAAALAETGDLAGKRFLLPRANLARDLLADELRLAGAEVADVTAYRTMPASTEREGDPDVYRMLLDRQIDAITFTSASTVRNFVEIIGREQAADLLRTTVVASIGPVTAEAAQQLGIARRSCPSLHDPGPRRRARRPFQPDAGSPLIWPADQPATPHTALPRRPRRLRGSPAMRALVRETRLSPDHVPLPALRPQRRGGTARDRIDARGVPALGGRGRARGVRGEGRGDPRRAAVRPARSERSGGRRRVRPGGARADGRPGPQA
jgi:uroporphyrinogen-III synthase